MSYDPLLSALWRGIFLVRPPTPKSSLVRKAEKTHKKFLPERRKPDSTTHQSPATNARMADVDKDTPINSLPSNTEDDDDPADDTPDYHLLASLTSNSQLPKRGEKDFEPHGTRHQDGILESSRQAMHDALSHTRFHSTKLYTRGFYYGEESLRRDDVVPAEWRQGLEDDHIVCLETAKGPHWKTMGKSTLGQRYASVWLLPEEALYLVERGNLDLWWPTPCSFHGVVNKKVEEGEPDIGKKQIDEGVPMSLQAAYALLIGKDGEKGKVSLERYTVYTNLKRNGYIVLRAPEWDPTKPGQKQEIAKTNVESQSVFARLWGRLFAESPIEPRPFAPLVRPGMYRSYNAIYRQMAIIPRYKPTPKNLTAPPPEDPYRVVFYIWRPDNVANFIKTKPGVPNFRVAITDARSTFVPSLTQVTSLLESTPWDPPGPESVGSSAPKLYQRLRHGWRNVVLAVVDQGVISYLRLGEAAFGEENLSEWFDQNNIGGSKRGGGAGRGRGGPRRGRGRGR